MTSHAATRMLAEHPLPDGRIALTVQLACGCTVTVPVQADRVIDTEDGLRLPVGKFSCPLDHPVRRLGG